MVKAGLLQALVDAIENHATTPAVLGNAGGVMWDLALDRGTCRHTL